MPYHRVNDNVSLFYKDWGSPAAQPIVFSHGWPLTADDWDAQMMFFLKQGYRVIAHDRRGHGRSTQTSSGHDMDTYAADLNSLVMELDLRAVIHVGHSAGGGEATRYVARAEPSRVAKLILISAVTPLMIKNDSNPQGTPISVFDDFRRNVAKNRAQFYYDVPSGPFYGFNREGAIPHQGIILNWWRQGMMGAANAHYECIAALSETDFTEDLRSITVPVLVMHGDADQVVPYKSAALQTIDLLKHGEIKIYPGLPHGMPTTNAEIINADIFAFARK